MASQNDPKFVLITGTSSGIGRACARRLAHEGFSVLAGVRNDTDARSLESEGNGRPLGIRAIRLDVTESESVRAAGEQVASIVGENGLCGLVNNAGTAIVGPVECISMDDWRRQFEVNFFGAIAVTQTMLPLLRTHRTRCGRWAPRIVNISSVTGQVSSPLFAAYSASKFALEAVSDALRLELASQGIHVCVIIPGTIQSEIWRKERACVDALNDCGEARTLYGQLIDNVSKFVFQTAEKSIPADHVAIAVQRCLTRTTPPTRTLVAWEAHVGSRARRYLPDRWFDYLMATALGVPRE